MKKGFTLIELLAVIIILAVIALIATPIVLDVVENAKEQSRLQSVNGVIDATRLYTNEALLNESLTLEGNLYSAIKDRVQGQIPETGEVYVNENNQVAVAIKLDKYCYVKDYNGEITKTEQENCLLYPPTDESCFEYRRLSDYIVNYDACVQVLASAPVNGKLYNEEERNLICTGGVASDGGSIESALDLEIFSIDDLIGLNVISNVQYKDEVSITAYNCYVGNTDGKEEITDIVIPNKINDMEVKRIGSAAFMLYPLTSVKFLSDLEVISSNAFRSSELSNVDLGGLKNLKTIELYAFHDNQISSLNVSDLTSLKTIGDGAFTANYITSLDLSNLTNLETIGEGAFGWNQLSGTLDLSDLKKLTTIGSSAFDSNYITGLDLSGLTNLESIGSDTFYGNQISSLNLKGLTNLKIIGEHAFEKNQISGKLDLSNLTSLETIEEFVFSANDLEEVILPSNIISIGNGAISSTGTSFEISTSPDDSTQIIIYDNPNLTKIVNPTGKSFDWNNIIKNGSGTPFETGTVTTYNGTVTITKE